MLDDDDDDLFIGWRMWKKKLSIITYLTCIKCRIILIPE